MAERLSVYDAFARAARDHADAPVFADARITYGTFADDVERLAAALHAAGVGPGDRVAIMLPKSPIYVRAILATRQRCVPWSFSLFLFCCFSRRMAEADCNHVVILVLFSLFNFRTRYLTI